MIVIRFDDGVLICEKKDLLFSKYSIITYEGNKYNIEMKYSVSSNPILLFRDYIEEDKCGRVLDFIASRVYGSENKDVYIDVSKV